MAETTKCYCRMVPLKKIIPLKYVEKIEEIVQNTSEIVREVYQFWKAVCLYRVENKQKIIPFDRSIAKLVIQTCVGRKPNTFKDVGKQRKLEENRRKNAEKSAKCEDEKTDLHEPTETGPLIAWFYETYYKLLQTTKFINPGKDILDCEIVQMQTAIENHIKGHFYNYVKRLAFSSIPKTEKNSRNKRVKLLKDLFENTFKSAEEHHALIRKFGPRIQKARKILYSEPQRCLPLLYKINRKLQAREEKTFAWLPLRKSIIPGSFALSKTICKELFGNNEGWDEICSLVGRLGIQPKQGYRLSSIRTAGSSASLIFSSKKKQPVEELQEKYIEDLGEDELRELQTKYIVAADPNKGNLLQMIDENGIRLRYTALQRKFETHSARYRKIRLKRDASTTSSLASEETVFLRDELVRMKQFNSRTTNFEEFLLYVKEKNLFADRFRKYYFAMWHRKFQFNIKTNGNRSRDRFLNTFQAHYGSPETTVLCVGDWEQRPGISFGKTPSMGVGIRNWFRKRRYQVYLVDECRTSLTCCKCHSENEYNWQYRLDPRPWKKGKIQKVWGLSRCQNSQCRVVHNRDVNSSQNILDICLSCINLQGRPTCFNRKNQAHATVRLDEVELVGNDVPSHTDCESLI